MSFELDLGKYLVLVLLKLTQRLNELLKVKRVLKNLFHLDELSRLPLEFLRTGEAAANFLEKIGRLGGLIDKELDFMTKGILRSLSLISQEFIHYLYI